MAEEDAEKAKKPLETEKPPNPWTVTNDYSKTVITLASGFLALTITFATQLVSKETPLYEKWLLVGTWIFLFLSILSSIVTVMLLVNHLQGNSGARSAVLFANASFLSLIAAGLCFIIFGSSTFVFNTKVWDAPTAVEKTLAKMSTFGRVPDGKWVVQSLRWDDSTKIYTLEVFEEKTKVKYVIQADAVKNWFTDVRRVE